MPLRSDMTSGDFLAVFWRRRFQIFFSTALILFAAVLYCAVAPELFRSTTTILVIPQRVPESYVHTTVSMRIEERLSTIRQQVLSRTHLIAVMNDLGLYRENRKTSSLDDLVESLRARIDIQVRGTDAFTLAFVNESPHVAMLATSKLASYFIDENLRAREQQAVGTSEFLESQLKETKTQLEAQEERVRLYKMRFMGQLPQQMEANLHTLTRLQDQYRTNMDAIRATEDRKAHLESQIGALEAQIAAQINAQRAAAQRASGVTVSDLPRAADSIHDPAASLLPELYARRTRYAELSARYTSRYPDVQRARRDLEEWELRVSDARKAGAASTVPDNSGRPGAATSAPIVEAAPQPAFPEMTEIRRLKTEISAIERELGNLRKDRQAIQASMDQFQKKVELSPQREQEMISLTRDYENLKRSYDDLLRKKLDADISQNLEKRQKGEQFQIIDPANLPDVPFSPNRRRIMAVALALAFIGGFGGAVGLEAIDLSLRGVKDFKHYFNLPILGVLPTLQTAEFHRRRTIGRIAVAAGFLLLIAGIGVLVSRYGTKLHSIFL